MSIYDFASTSAESVKDTDFSTNYGFNVVPNATGIPYDEHFSRGLYHYANIGKDADQLRLAQEAFGKNMLDKKFAPYWIGEAVVREHGFSDITQAYIAYDIPIPEGVTDSMQLSATLGQGILDKYSKQYDTAKAAREKSANRAANNQQKLMAGTIKPADLDPEQTQELVDIYGYHPADAYSAGEIIRSRDKKDILSQVWEPTKFMLAEAASLPSRIGEFGAYAFKGDFKDAFRRLAHSSSGWEKIATQSLEGTRSALANNLASDAKFLALANNPEKALQIAQNHFYKKEKELLDNATALGRAVLKTHDIVQDTYQGAGDLLVSATGAINAAIGNADDPRQAQRVSATIADAKAAARAEVQESHELYGWMEKGFDAIAETARFANPYTAVPAVASLFRDCAGRSFNSIANEDGSLPSDSNLEVYGKAAANAAINYASRNVGTKVMPRVMSRGLTKLGVNSSAARYAANAGWTTAGFGIVLPVMDSGLRAAYDALAVKNPKLKDGIRDLENWWNKDLRSPSYWGTQSLVGAFFGITGQRNYHRAGKFLAQNAEMSGLSHDEADSIRRSTILEDQPQAYQKAISDNLLNKPQETIDLALANTRKTVAEQEQLAVEEKGKKAESDAALQASMRFYGLSFAEGKDSDHVTMLIGGNIDKATGKYIEGTKSVSLTKKDAAFYIGNLLDARTASRTTAIREMMGRALFIDAAKKHLEGQIEIQYILSPLDMNQMIQNGTEAQAKIDKLTKDLIEKSKGEDGKPTLSEADARSQAEQTKEGDRTLGEIAKFGREVQSRLSQEQNKQLSQDPDKSFISNAYVLSKGKRSDNSLRRIFKIAWGATTRNMMEEYSEQWMQDYFFATGSDYTDLWRLLSDLSAHLNIPNFTLATLRNSNPALAERLDNGLTSQDITDTADFDAIYRDVTEGLSVLLMADLGKLSADGKLPEWTQELLDSKFLTDQLMEQEMALAAALDTARSMGADKPAMLRLLDLNANEAQRIISSIENPTVDQFFDTYVSTVKEYEALQGNPTGLSADAIESTMVQHAKDAEALAKQVKDADDERNAAAIEAVKEAESLPENKDKPHEQIVEEVNERITAQKEEDIAENPASVDDSSSTNGKAVVTYDDGSLSCHMAMVNIADLTMMPNFKSGSDKDTGEVEQLTGDYHPDHAPIRILRRTDGTLMVISGRHRLAHAKRYGAKKIAAYIYDETPEHDLKWAQLKDIEWNIKDNQATPLDVALLIRGELIDGIPPLDDASIIRMGITRKGSQAIIGYNIGKNATPALMDAWRNDPDTFTTDTTRRIAQFAPNNPLIQRAGIKAATEGITGKNLLTIMSMEQDRINCLQNSGIAIQLDLFNEADFDTTYNDFVNNYAFNKVNKLNLRIAALRTAEKVANDADFAEAVQGSGLRIDNALRKRYQNRKNKPMSPQEERMLWSNPWTNIDVIGEEINNAFANEYPEEWAKMQERKAEQAAALEPPTAEDTPDLGNSVQGDVSSIPTWNFSVKAQQGNATALDAEKAKLFTNGNLSTSNAIITQPGSSINFSVTALHASRKEFYKFLTDFMGSGEGTQAFGWGLYFAEALGVNRWYLNLFAKDSKNLSVFKIGNKAVTNEEWIAEIDKIIEDTVKDYDTLYWIQDTFRYNLHASDPRKTLKQAKGYQQKQKEFIENTKDPLNKSIQEEYLKKAYALEEVAKALIKAGIYAHAPAFNYKVELNVDDNNLLMWDSMLNMHDLPEEIFALLKKARVIKEKDSLSELAFKYSKNGRTVLDRTSEDIEDFLYDMGFDIEEDYSMKELSEMLNKAIAKAEKKEPSLVPVLQQMQQDTAGFIKGANLYNYLERIVGSKKEASELLYKFGFKGIKFLDRQSRNVGEGTYNYVIFSGDDIKITAINKSGVWSMDEGWEAYDDPTALFSAVDKDTLKAWQQDPTLGLGMLGSFENNILNKFAPTHDDLVDAELVAMINDVTRRIKELHHVNAKGTSETLMAEMAAIIIKLNSRLPQGYRFGLEGYQMFTATYANLHKYGDPDTAASVLPMDKWPEIMAKSFRKTFERLLKGKLTEQEETSFFNRYDSELVGVDLDAIRKDLNSTRRKYLKEATRQFPAEAKFTDAYKAAVADARERAYDDVKARHEAAFAKAYEAIATMRADRLMDKFLTRIIHQLNKYRKDRIINKIGRALASITPTKQKKGKPVKGTVSMETYNTVLDNYRLMRLTTAQKDSFEEANPNLADKDPQETLDVPTFDHEGTPITLKVTVQQYLTYASLDSMSAEHALAASQALGTLIASGKEAWQLKAEAEREELKAFTAPIYNKYAEDENQQGIRQRNENAFITFGKGVAKGIKRFLVGLYNDGQFFDVISAAPGLEQFKKVQDRIAKAHTYMESAEKQNHLNLIKAACAACGIKNADPFHLTGEQEQKLARFMEAINERKQLEGSDQITLTIQPPDFEAQQRDIFRTRFMRRLQFITNKKNYNPHELAVALEHVRPYLPADIYHEAMEKYGNAGDTSLYDGKVETALVNTFPLEKFGSLINLNNSIRETAAEKLAKWHEDNPTTSVTFTEMTRSEAAFKVLMTEQPDLAESLRQQGYTDAVIKQLKNFAGKDMMDFAYALREHMNERLPQLKSIYESTYGTPFPAVENYFRAFFNVSSQETSTAQQEGMPFGSNGKSEGGLRLFNTRVKHNHSIMPTMDVVHAFYLGMKEQDNLIAYADSTTGQHIGEFMRKVLSSKQGRTTMHQVLENAIGSQATAALNEHVENMYRIYGHTESYNAALNRGVSDMGTAATISLLTMRLTSIFKNALAFTNTLGGSDKISAWQWIKEAGKAMALQKGAITAKELMQDPLIRDRFKGWDTESYIDTIMIQAGVKPTLNWGTKLARRGLSVFGAYDRWATAKSAAILYNAVYNKLQKQNPSMTDAELRIEAYDAVAQALGVKGQPMDFHQRPLTSTRNNFMTAAYYFLGGEALNTFGNCLRLLAKASFKTPEGRQALGNLAAVWLVNGAMMSLINYGFNFLLDDEEHWKKRSFLATMGWGILHGPLSGIPLVSNIIAEAEEGAGRLFGFNPPYLSTPSYLPMSNIFTQIGNLRKVVSEKSSTWDKTIAANDAIRAILFLGLVGTQRPTTKTGVAIKTAGIIGAAASNAIDFLLRLGRAADERWITPVPEPKKKVKKPKKSTSPKRSPRQNNSDDILSF